MAISFQRKGTGKSQKSQYIHSCVKGDTNFSYVVPQFAIGKESDYV